MPRFAGFLSVLLLLALAPIVLTAARAEAQAEAQAAPTTAPTEAQRARARQLYGQGQAHFDAGRFQRSLAAFEGAYREVPNPIVLIGVASAQERLGRTEDAARTLRRYLRERPDAPDREAITARITALDPTGATADPAEAQGTLRIVCTPPGASIVIDGEDTGRTAPAELQVPPGEHTITLTLEGHQPVTDTVTVAPGGIHELALTLAAREDAAAVGGGEDPDAFGEGGEGTADVEGEGGAEGEGEAIEPAPPVDSGPSTGVWVTTAVAGVGLVTGTVFGFLALSAQSDFDASPTADAADRGETFALVADLAFGVAIAAGITAIVLYATDRPATEETASASSEQGPRVTVAPWGAPSGGGAAVQVQF
ncbi:MAG: PEGA domain-containing protein [Myxococcota bacterium]|nr:PEGA domain-containing protein [Myxococcota bacterium]